MKKISTLLFIISISLSQSFGQATWLTMASGLGSSAESVKAIVGHPSFPYDVYAGGTFTGSINYLAKWDGTSWQELGTGVNGPVYALVLKNNELYVAGAFTLAGGVAVHNIAKWSGGVWSDVDGGFNDQVNALYLAADVSGTIYAGGRFSQSGTNTMNHISKLVNGTWTQIGTGINSVVNAISNYGNSPYAGTDDVSGPVQKFNGTTWAAVSGLSSGKCYALTVFSNFLYAGGDFTIPTPAAAKYDGTNWSTIQTTFSTSDKVYALYPRYSTVLYIGGKFTNLGIPGAQASNVARINSTITPIQTITVTSSTIDGDVYAIGSMGGKVVAGGKFASPATNVAITSTTIDVNELSNLIIDKTFFPNPTHGISKLTVSTRENLKNTELMIFDIQSRLVENLNIDKSTNGNKIEFRIDCSDLSKGTYYYLLNENGKSILTDKFIVE